MPTSLLKPISRVAAAAASALVLVLSWVPDSHLARLPWMPSRVGRWLDAGGVMTTARTGIAMAGAAGLLHLARRGQGARGTVALALGLLVLAEAGQLLIAGRRASLMDLAWGAGGVGLGVLTAAALLPAEEVPPEDTPAPTPPDA